MIFKGKEPKKQTGLVILIFNKKDFNSKLLRRNGGGHYIFNKGGIHQKDIAILNIYTPNTSAPKFIEEILLQLKLHTDSHTVIMVDFSNQFSPIQSILTKLNREMLGLNDVINQIILTEICRIYISSHYKGVHPLLDISRNFFKSLSHKKIKGNINKYAKFKIISCTKQITIDINNYNNTLHPL